MKKYEGLFIFTQSMDDNALEEKLEKARGEMTRLGGTVLESAKWGRQSFSRHMGKKDSGIYALITFELDPAKVAVLSERFRLNEDIFRVQIVLAPRKAPEKAASAGQPAAV
ncbi:MAG: 30S ribosomal protein S6 [Lentisphaerae bacterium]|nr:30S ribosomal protein S6 [Lentisphaerota bacterium]